MPETKQPEISIIVPVYDVEDHVAACIDSIKDQTFTDFEALIIDDGSTDGSIKEARRVLGSDPRFTILSKENGGLSSARNFGLKHAKGNHIAFVDSDDRVAPDFLDTLLGALRRFDADWVSCAIQYSRNGVLKGTHSAIHGAAGLEDRWGATSYSLNDWRDVIRHFPSAWNKLYKRSLLDGVLFDEGTYFEDHAFFYRCALKTNQLVHVPKPFYWHTQDRAGQITHQDSDRVFEQFAVLDTMKKIISDSGKTGKSDGFQRAATRLIFERSKTVVDIARRKRLVKTAQSYFREHRLRFERAGDRGILASWESMIDGVLPVSVIIPTNGDLEPLGVSLKSLQAQSLKDYEVLIVGDSLDANTRKDIQNLLCDFGHAKVVSSESRGAARARNCGLRLAKGQFVVFLDAGDELMPGSLSRWFEALTRTASPFGFSQFRAGGPQGAVHNGFHDRRGIESKSSHGGVFKFEHLDAFRLHAHPSAKIFNRDFLTRNALEFSDDSFAGWPVTIGAALYAGTGYYFAFPDAIVSNRTQDRKYWQAAVEIDELKQVLNAVNSVVRNEDLQPIWKPKLFARMVWEKINFSVFASEEAKAVFLNEVRSTAAGFDMGDVLAVDPYIGPRVKKLLGMEA